MRIARSKFILMLEDMPDTNHANSLLYSGQGIRIHKGSNKDSQLEIQQLQLLRFNINTLFGYIRLIAIRSELDSVMMKAQTPRATILALFRIAGIRSAALLLCRKMLMRDSHGIQEHRNQALGT